MPSLDLRSEKHSEKQPLTRFALPNRKLLLAMSIALVLCVATGACAGCGEPERARTAAGSDLSTPHHDRDNDGDHNDDDGRVLNFGHEASGVERRPIEQLIVHYMAAAAAENGVRACQLLAPRLREVVVEQDIQALSQHDPCAATLSKLFESSHRKLVEKAAALKVIAVRVSGRRALGVLSFPEIPEERQFGVRRVNGRWKAFSTLDGIIE